MCGICGVICLNHTAVHTNRIQKMTDALAHRGPDDAGYLLFHTGCRHSKKVSFELHMRDDRFSNSSELLPPLASSDTQKKIGSHDWDLFMGHRRLSILDLTVAGHQPMCDLSKNIWVSFNGEIYNYKEIRTELSALGHHFHTQTDTEVIIYAYIEWGISCIHKFNGMFAFSLYDNFRKKMFLARDRYGIKPVYYTITTGQKRAFVFASEVKGILEYLDGSVRMDFEALVEYLTFQNIFSNRTLYRGIRLLEPGHYICLELETADHMDSVEDVSKTCYWDYNFQELPGKVDERGYVEELKHLFKKAMKRQLISDVEVGSYLSGGMDSGAISCIASKSLPDLKTFTVGFDMNSVSGMELVYDERHISEYLSYLYKTEHYEMVLKSGDMERCMPRFAWHLEEPRVGQSYPNYYAAKLAGNFVKVVLSGTGGDELFGGYPWRYYRAVVNKDIDQYIDKYFGFWQRLISERTLAEVVSPIWNKVNHIDTRDIFKSVFRGLDATPETPESYVNYSLYFEAKTFLHGLFVVEDKLSMAASLETRVPFMDNDLVDFAMSLPVKYKLGNLQEIINLDENEIGDKQKVYFSKSRDGKLLLRKMMEKYVPMDIAKGIKQGFSSPDRSWFKGDSINYVRKKLYNKDAKIYNYLNSQVIRTMVDEHLSGARNRRLLIWSLLNLEQWMEIFLD